MTAPTLDELQQLKDELEEKNQLLRELQSRMSLLVNNNVLAVVEWVLDCRMRNWNFAAEKIFGYSREESLGGYIDVIVAPEALPHVAAVQDRLRNGEPLVHSVNNNLTKDGRIITCEWYNVPLIDPD